LVAKAVHAINNILHPHSGEQVSWAELVTPEIHALQGGVNAYR
jgi:hypothetical protein